MSYPEPAGIFGGRGAITTAKGYDFIRPRLQSVSFTPTRPATVNETINELYETSVTNTCPVAESLSPAAKASRTCESKWTCTRSFFRSSGETAAFCPDPSSVRAVPCRPLPVSVLRSSQGWPQMNVPRRRRPNQSTCRGRRKTGGGYSRVRRTSDRKVLALLLFAY
jgi:hypothetical protein